jgi:predicted PurR-regulated permease PerM
MIFTQDPLQALLFLIFLTVLQQLEGNIIYPRVVGTSIGLPGIWVLASFTIGSGLMGVPGMLLGVPVAAAAYRLLGADVNKRLKPQTAETPPTAAPLPDETTNATTQEESQK